MSSEAKPYTKEEAAELGTSHYGASAARVRATVAELESAGREIERLKSYLGNFLGLDEMEKLRKSNAVLRESVIALNVLFEGVAEAAKYVGEKEPEELWSHIEDVVAERDSLRAEMERMKLDEQMLSDDDDACHRLLDAALGEGSLATTSMETLLERLPRLIDERDSLRSQRDALAEALEKFTKVGIRNWTHNEECARSEDCEDMDAAHPCNRHDEPCPSCECGMSGLYAADDAARAALLRVKQS